MKALRDSANNSLRDSANNEATQLKGSITNIIQQMAKLGQQMQDVSARGENAVATGRLLSEGLREAGQQATARRMIFESRSEEFENAQRLLQEKQTSDLEHRILDIRS